MKKLIAIALLSAPLLAVADTVELPSPLSFAGKSMPSDARAGSGDAAGAPKADALLPEPQTPALFGAGLLAIGFVMNRRQPR